MKKNISLFILTFFSISVFAQNEIPKIELKEGMTITDRNRNVYKQTNKGLIISSKIDTVYGIVDVPAKFPGGEAAFFEFLSTNIVYPVDARNKNQTGRSIIRFVVNSNGMVFEPVLLSSSGYPLLDNEAIRVINSLPDWIPAQNNGKNVSSLYSVPIVFKLDDIVPEDDSKTIYETPQIPAFFNGGERMLEMYLKWHHEYPKEARENKIEGIAYVKFIIDTKGNVKDPIIQKSSGFEILDEAAVKLISELPEWQPAIQGDFYVNSYKIIPIMYKLGN